MQEPDCSNLRWNVASRDKEVYEKEFRKVIRQTGRIHTGQAQPFPSRNKENDGFGSIMVFWTCIQINREKYKITPQVYRDEFRKVKTRYN